MKSLVISSIALIVVLWVRPVSGQTFTFDETGRGTEITTSGGTLPIPFSTTPAPLTYHLGYASAPGDILILEPTGTNQALSDILRFDANGNVTVFSDMEPGEAPDGLADVPVLPAPLPVSITVLENGPGGSPGSESGINGLFGYTPAPGTPGASPAGVAPVTFNFVSDVPEPSSWGLLVLGLGVALLARRRRPIA
ncbi:MAG TPA: PEP-CTERM sorting domain-containing protein [Tepidisphaeraceae bacterium]|nr:PEP-CTERM sorting domain-containing protein [Tepidisphaeraceae bacterium]